MPKKILGLTCTNGRFSYLKRLLSCFINQDYDNKILLIYNNADIPIKIVHMENVVLINNNIDLVTGDPYKDVGSIHRDAMTFFPDDIDYVSIMDDDDIFLPNHFRSAIDHFEVHPDCRVWQPGHYFFKYSKTDVEYKKTDNNLEGSCVLEYEFLKEVGFEVGNSLRYNLHWYLEAEKRKVLCLDDSSKATFCCEYGQTNITHTSIFTEQNPGLSVRDINKNNQKHGNYGEGELLTPWTDVEYKTFLGIYFNMENYQ